MLSPDKLTPRIDPSRDTGNDADFIDFDKLIAIARRQWRMVAACGFAFAILGIVYVLTSVPVYTADTSVLIDRSDSQVINQLAAFGQMDDDEGTVLSQVELLKSDTIAYAVVDKLKLVDNPEFMPAEVFIKIGDRTVISYLTKPLTDQMQHVFRQE